VVRTTGPTDDTRAYVAMPSFEIFEEYARRVEDEMPAVAAELTHVVHQMAYVFFDTETNAGVKKTDLTTKSPSESQPFKSQ
jgi:hypothetical protein